MSVNSNKYIVQTMERISFFELENGVCQFVVDDLQEANMTNEQETVYATGKNGVKIGSSDRNKASRITATNGAIVDGVMAMQVGSEVVTGKTIVPKHLFILTTEDGATLPLTIKPVGETGNEIPYVYKRNTDGTVGQAYPIAAEASAEAFKYDPASKTITLPTDVFKANESVYVFYDIEVEDAKKISNYEDKFSATGMLIADCFAKDICTEKSYYAKIIYPKAKASGNFELAFGNDPSVQNMEFEALSGGCGASQNKLLWDFIVFDEEDAVEL